MERIKKNDTVAVITGKDKGKTGKVFEILPKKGKVMVKGVALVKKHAKARKQGERSGIKIQESFVKISNVMPICSACRKPTRVRGKLLEHGKRVRVCIHCRESF